MIIIFGGQCFKKDKENNFCIHFHVGNCTVYYFIVTPGNVKSTGTQHVMKDTESRDCLHGREWKDEKNNVVQWRIQNFP